MSDLVLVTLDRADVVELLQLLDHAPARGLAFDHRDLLPRVRAALAVPRPTDTGEFRR